VRRLFLFNNKNNTNNNNYYFRSSDAIIDSGTAGEVRRLFSLISANHPQELRFFGKAMTSHSHLRPAHPHVIQQQ